MFQFNISFIKNRHFQIPRSLHRIRHMQIAVAARQPRIPCGVQLAVLGNDDVLASRYILILGGRHRDVSRLRGSLAVNLNPAQVHTDINILIALCINIVIDYLVLRYINRLERLLGGTLISILRKFFGVILLAIGVKLFTTNLGSMVHGYFVLGQ